MKLDPTGIVQWTKTVGGAGDEWAYSLVQTSDGGYAIAGLTTSFGAGSSDFYIVKLDSMGSLQWTRTVGGINSDSGCSLVQTNDGGYTIAGYAYSFGAGLADAYIVKLDPAGTVQWTKIVGGVGTDYALSIVQTTDGGFAIAGYSDSFGAGIEDAYIVKLDPNGNTCCSSGSGGTSGTGGISGSGGTSGTGGVSGSGGTAASGGILTVDCNTVGIEPLSPVVSSSILNVHPNPTTGVFTVHGQGTISVFDLLGNLLLSEPVNRQVDLSAFPNGIYVVKVDSTTIKLILAND